MLRTAPRADLQGRLFLAFLAFGAALLGCASAPTPDPNSTIVWGYVRLVPKAGSHALGGGYGDRRLDDARRVDYSHTRYAVVFASGGSIAATSPTELVIRESAGGPRLDPPFAATMPRAGLRILNATDSDQIVSVPSAGRLHRLAPGTSLRVTKLPPGEIAVHLLGLAAAEAPSPTQIWVTEGVTAEVEPSGRYTLRGLEPGTHRLRAWHPRLPPSPAYEVLLENGRVNRVDIEIGLDARPPRPEVTQ